MKFDRQLRPATETSWMVSYGGRTIPDGRHFENRYIAISQWKIIWFRWNFVHSSRFLTGWTSHDQKWKVALDRLRVRQNVCLVTVDIFFYFLSFFIIFFLPFCVFFSFSSFSDLNLTETLLFLLRVSTLTRDIDLSVCPSVCLSVHCVPVFYGNGSTYCHSLINSSPHGSPIILVLWISNVFAKFQRRHPQRWLQIQVGYKKLVIFDQ